MNFDAISKNAKILKIGLVEAKLWKIRQIAAYKSQSDDKDLCSILWVFSL